MSDPDVQQIVPKMKRGDLDKMSFAFSPTVQQWDDSEDMPLRSIEEAALYDVSIVTNPAYEGTEIGLRSAETALKDLEKHRKEQISNGQIQARMRMKLALAEA